MLENLTEVERATERLKGIMMGIAADNWIVDDEVLHLSDWLETHPYFHDREPFKTVVSIIERVLDDHYIDEDEREEILDLCCTFDDHALVPKVATTAIRRLHGVLHGIAIDNKIEEQEVRGLGDWLNMHEQFQEYWPFSDICSLVKRILEDGVVDERERVELLEYCGNFGETHIKDPVIHDEMYAKEFAQTYSSSLQPFTDLCDRKCKIEFKNHTFCFTGPARTGPRKELHKIVESLGGRPSKTVIRELDYLVIGAQSSPCWVYSTYGRKIEKVMEYRKQGDKTAILHEDDFITQAT